MKYVGRSSGRRWAAALLAAGLLVAACGDDDGGGEGAASTAASGAGTTTAAEDGATTMAESGETTTAEADAETTTAETSAETSAGSGATTPADGEDLLAPQPLAEPTTLTMTGSAGRPENALVAQLAIATGEFEAENLTIEFSELPTADGMSLLVEGETDLMSMGLGPGQLNLIADGAQMRAVWPLGYPDLETSQEGWWVRKEILGDDGFQPSDLEGQAIATPNPFSSLNAVLVETLREIDPEFQLTDVTVEQLPLGDIPVALIQGGVNVGLALSPQWLEVQASGCCEYIPGYPSGSLGWYAFGPTMLDPANREAATAFVRTLARTTQKYLVDQDYKSGPVAAEVAEALGVDEATLAELPEIIFPTEVTDDYYDELLTTTQEFLFAEAPDQLTYTDRILLTPDIVDWSFAREVTGG